MTKSVKRNSGIENQLIVLSLELHATLYPKLYVFENQLKNRLFRLIQKELGGNWFYEQLSSNSGLSLFKQEAELILKRKPAGFKLEDKGLLVESGLGLWVEFFNKVLYKETKGVPIKIFKNLPKQVKRKLLYQKLSNVKEMRNLLFHSRISPITKMTQLEQLENILNTHQDLNDILSWMGDVPFEILQLNTAVQKADRIKELLSDGSL